MTDHGDADDDDPQLGGLRSLWLSMPDEDPPERGLADLMAAARVKADEMAQPSLWQRVVAMMRRPPVLALATVMVLVAGAVLVGNHHEKLESRSAPAADEGRAAGSEEMMQAAPVTIPTPEPAAAPGAALGNGATFDPSTAEAEPKVDSAAPGKAPKTTSGKSRRVTSSTATVKAAKGSTAGDDMLNDGEGVADEPLKKAGERRDTKPAPEPRAEKLQLAEPEAPAEDTEDTIAGGMRAQTPTADAAPAKNKQQQGAAQLHAQARTAASRNDCAAVKVMVQRIAKQDPAYYRANVTKDAAIAKCTGTAH